MPATDPCAFYRAVYKATHGYSLEVTDALILAAIENTPERCDDPTSQHEFVLNILHRVCIRREERETEQE